MHHAVTWTYGHSAQLKGFVLWGNNLMDKLVIEALRTAFVEEGSTQNASPEETAAALAILIISVMTACKSDTLEIENGTDILSVTLKTLH